MIGMLNSVRGWKMLSIKRIRGALAKRALMQEATLYLLAAKLAVKWLPFRYLEWYFKRPSKQPELVGAKRKQVRDQIRFTIYEVAERSPVEFVCFPKAIAAQAMLRRRRISTVLYYGAANDSLSGLTTHVWVQDGAEGVVGKRAAEGYNVLARYPETS